MRKPILIGGGLGLLVLAIAAAFVWMTEPRYAPVASVVQPSDVRPAAALAAQALPATSAPSSAAMPSVESRQERRRRLAEVRAEFNALRAKGAQASPEKMRMVVDELEALSPPGFDPRYFQALRNMLDASAKVQTLNSELQGLLKSSAPKDLARKEAILAEMRLLGARVSAEAQNLQAHAPALVPKAAQP